MLIEENAGTNSCLIKIITSYKISSITTKIKHILKGSTDAPNISAIN